MKNNGERLKWGLVVFTFICMTVFGLLESLSGPAVPAIVEQFSIKYTAIGTMMLLCTLGYLTGTLVGGIATDRFGFKPVFIVAYLLVIITALLIRFAQNFAVVVMLSFIMRIGLGGFETGVNGLGAKIFVRATATMMNIMHLFFGLGSVAGTQLMGRILANGLAWYNGYTAAGIIIIAGLAVTLFMRFPEARGAHEADEALTLKSIPVRLKDGVLWVLVLALGFSELMELGTGGWMVNYLNIEQGLNHEKSAFYLTMFFVFFSIARLFGGWIAEKVGYLYFVIICGGLSSALFFAGFALGGQYNILISLSGAPVAMLFPTIMAIIVKHYKTHVTSVMGIIIAGAGIVFMLGSQMIGIIADGVSVKLSFMIVGFAGIVSAIFLISARRKIGKEVNH